MLRAYYRFFGSRAPALNRAWIDVLMESANSGGGMYFTAEPGTKDRIAQQLR
ncbi:DUF7882 family protein [Subtercola boreus]|uniref:DUF7882 family protein n=1 Tax=Subtercola boreus TaxID=120213 RepID=UPI003F5ABA7E